MRNESDFKKVFKKSVRAQGGYSISLAAPMLIGTPDLYVLAKGFIPVLLEAKWLGELRPGFKRKIPYTALQKDFVDGCNDVHECTAFGLIGFKLSGEIWCTLSVWDYISHSEGVYQSLTPENKLFNVSTLFACSGVPKLNGTHAPLALPTEAS